MNTGGLGQSAVGVESTDKTVLCSVGVRSYCQGGNARGVALLENATDEYSPSQHKLLGEGKRREAYAR